MPTWTTQDNALCATFTFTDFVTAFAFMSAVALVAEKQNHHPAWSNVYNLVSFRLNTHDANDTVTEKDCLLAKAIDNIYQKFV
jgi:4a-hydroxytetrahydrobiopterin dehydratase